MFTWEEAGLLRQLLLVLKWTTIVGLLLTGACFWRSFSAAGNDAGQSYYRRMPDRKGAIGPPSPAGL